MQFISPRIRFLLGCLGLMGALHGCANGPSCTSDICDKIKGLTGGSQKPPAQMPPPRPQAPPPLTASCDTDRVAELVAPTLLEPFDRPPQGWYVDTLAQGAQMSMINVAKIQSTRGRRMTFAEMAALRRQRPDVYALLNLAYMPNLSDVALMGRAARMAKSGGVDANLILTDVESTGHELARAMAKSPADAKFIEDNVQSQRENLNGMAARAAVGDAASMAELSTLADRALKTEVGAAASASTTSYAKALHCMRVRSMTDGGSFDAFWLLKTPSFETALRRVSLVEVMMKLPVEWIKDEAGGGFDRNVLRPRAQAGCFPLESNGWESSEVKIWNQFCGSDVHPVVTKAGICNSREAFRTMSLLATTALLSDPSLVPMRALLAAGRGVQLVRINVEGVEAIDGHRAKDGLHCVASGEPIYGEGQPRAGSGLMQAASVPMDFLVNPVAAGRATFSLVLLMGNKPSLPWVATAATR